MIVKNKKKLYQLSIYMDIALLSLFLFIITTMLYISGVPVIGKPDLKLVNNTLTSDDLMNYYSDCMKKMAIFLLIVLCTQLTLNVSYLIDKCQGSAGKMLELQFFIH